jgi:TnpA family transposase
MLSKSDTAYPHFKNIISQNDLEQFYTPTAEEIAFCRGKTRNKGNLLGLVVLLKTFQRLGYFVNYLEMPKPILAHVASRLKLTSPIRSMKKYEKSSTRQKHLNLIREYLNVKPFVDGGLSSLTTGLRLAATTREDIADIINMGIEILVRDRFELPSFNTISREARTQRASINNEIFIAIHDRLEIAERKFLDSLFVVSEQARISPWNELKADSPKPTLNCLRDLIKRHDRMGVLAKHNDLLENIAYTKVEQLAIEAQSLNAAVMAEVAPAKRYVLTLALIRRRFSQITDDLCVVFCKQMRKIKAKADEKLENYIKINQEKTDEVLRRFATISDTLEADHSEEERLKIISSVVLSRPDLTEYSRTHAEYGGKHATRFMWDFYAVRRADMFRILSKLEFVSTSQDDSLIRAMRFVTAHRTARKEWIPTYFGNDNPLLKDISWIPGRWRKLITGKTKKAKEVPEEINRRHFEICVFEQLVADLNSADICVLGSETYSDYRQELLPLEECEKSREEYGKQAGLPVEGRAFTGYLQGLLNGVATKADEFYPSNEYFKIEDGRPKLARLTRKLKPKEYERLEATLEKKINKQDVSILDIMTDTMKWLNWGRFFGPLSGHKGKVKEEERRYILTPFAYGTGMGPTQTAKSVSGINERQISFINRRHVTAKKLDEANREIINEYNRFDLPKYFGDPKRAAADGTKWDLYDNNLFSEYHIRYGGYGGIAYYHVSDTYIALFSHFIPCGVYEAIYILDGLTKNDSEIQPDTLHGDTHAQSATVYALAFLLGIKIMPRIRKWKDLKWFKPAPGDNYQNINELFTKDPVNWKLIEQHLPDMLQVAQSIKAGRISPSTILRRLGTASRKNKLYYAFRELGRVVRTAFLLEYISDKNLRRIIQGSTNKCESFNNFAGWVYFADSMIRENVRDEQVKIVKYNHLVANLIIFHNVQSMTKAFREIEEEGEIELTPDLLGLFSPYRTNHIGKFGLYEVRDREVADLEYDFRFLAKPDTTY